MRFRMCCVGWVVWVHGFCYFCFFSIIQPEDGQRKVSKHVVVIYVINIIYIHQIVVLDSRYTPILCG